MQRSFIPELLDSDTIPADEVARAQRALMLTHTLLGNRAAIMRALRRHDGSPIQRVLDVGCGHGGMLGYIREQLAVDVIGADLRPPRSSAVPIVRADASTDPLPEADVAISLCLAHHLTDDQLMNMVRNVGRSCRRFVLLDLVRSRLPLLLFQASAPFVLPRLNVVDGVTSIRRAYTPGELYAIISRAVAGKAFHHSVAPFNIRQIVDITY